MTRPTPKVYFAPGYTWQTEPDAITWVDITASVMDRRAPLTTTRGSTTAHAEPDAGQLNLVLRSSTRDFDPLHATGPYFGLLVPGVPVKIEAECGAGAGDDGLWGVDDGLWGVDDALWGITSGVTLPVWRGTIKGWPQRYDRGNTVSVVPVLAYDTLEKLARAKVERSVVEAEVLADSPRGFWNLNESSGMDVLDASTNGLNGTSSDPLAQRNGTLETPDGATYPAFDLDGDVFAVNIPNGAQYLSHSVGALVDLSGATDLVDGQRLVILEYGTGDGRLAAGAFQWGIEVIDASDRTARLFVRGSPALWSNYGYSASFSYAQPRHVASRCAALFGVTMAHYVDGVVSTGASNPTDLGYHPNGVRLFSGKNNDDPFVGIISSLYWNSTTVATAARVAVYADAALSPLLGGTSDARTDWVLDQIDWPDDLRDLDVGETPLGAATFKPGDNALSYLRLVARSEDSYVYADAEGKVRIPSRYWRYLDTLATVSQVEFTDNGGIGTAVFDLTPEDDEHLVNVARFTRRGGAQQVAADDVSREAYGEAELALDDLLHQSDTVTKAQAQWTVATRSTPVPQVDQVTVRVHKLSAADQEVVLGLDIGHRVTCTKTPQGVGDPITSDFVVAGINHTVTAVEWLSDFYLTPAPDLGVELFTLGTSVLGGADILAY